MVGNFNLFALQRDQTESLKQFKILQSDVAHSYFCLTLLFLRGDFSLKMRDNTWRNHRVWKITRFLCLVEGVENDFRGAAIIGNYPGKKTNANKCFIDRHQNFELKIHNRKFCLSFYHFKRNRSNNPKIG